jgi:hypothetical protein
MDSTFAGTWSMFNSRNDRQMLDSPDAPMTSQCCDPSMLPSQSEDDEKSEEGGEGGGGRASFRFRGRYDIRQVCYMYVYIYIHIYMYMYIYMYIYHEYTVLSIYIIFLSCIYY